MTTDAAGMDARDEMGVLLVYLADQGYADEVGSWISESVSNLPLTGEQLRSALPDAALDEAAAELGLSVEDYAEQLAASLPSFVDGLTQNGELPTEDEYDSVFEEFVQDASDGSDESQS